MLEINQMNVARILPSRYHYSYTVSDVYDLLDECWEKDTQMCLVSGNITYAVHALRLSDSYITKKVY